MLNLYCRAVIFFVLCALPLLASAGSFPQVEVSAKAAILMNADTGAVLWEKNAHLPLYPASITKMITALYAIEKKGHALDDLVTASLDAISTVHSGVRRSGNGTHPPWRLEFGGTHMGIRAGEVLALRTLIHGLMLASGNDAANVIAEHLCGDIARFMEELNRFVREKGCMNTVLHTPHGLPHDDHKTTAYDMALLAREFLKKDFLREVVKATQYPRPKTNKQPESVLHQHNALVKQGRFHYPKAIGIKTGYTVAAGYTLVTAAEDQNRSLIVVLLGCEKIEQRYKDAIALFEAGFNEKKMVRTLFSRGFDLFSHPIEGGNIPLQGCLAQDVQLAYYPSEEIAFKTVVRWLPFALPVRAGQEIAEMQVLSPEGRLLSAAPVYAVRDVEPTFGHRMHLICGRVKKELCNHVALMIAAAGILIVAGGFFVSKKA